MTPSVTIIVPVYNAEKFLRETLESALSQTFADFELLLVDDGSTDSSPSICDELSGQDRRVRVIHQQNQGVSAARNTGIEAASGEYILFIDNDDFLYPDSLEVMVREIGDADLLVCDYIECRPSKVSHWRENRRKGQSRKVAARSVQEIRERFDDIYRVDLSTLWHQLFRREIIHRFRIRFEKIQSEDELFCYTYFSHIESVRRIDFVSYLHVVRDDSQGHSHKYLSDMDWIEQIHRLHDDIRAHFSLPHGCGFDQSVHFQLGLRMVSYIIKGYYRDTRLPFSERMGRWKEVRKRSGWYDDVPLAAYPAKARAILTVSKCPLAYPLADLGLIIYSR